MNYSKKYLMETSKQIVCFDQVELFGNAKIDFRLYVVLLEICIAVTSVQTTYIQRVYHEIYLQFSY